MNENEVHWSTKLLVAERDIKQLQQRIEELEKELNKYQSIEIALDFSMKEEKKLQQENARLKEALEEIEQTLDMLFDKNYDLQTWRDTYQKTIREIAQKARE